MSDLLKQFRTRFSKIVATHNKNWKTVQNVNSIDDFRPLLTEKFHFHENWLQIISDAILGLDEKIKILTALLANQKAFFEAKLILKDNILKDNKDIGANASESLKKLIEKFEEMEKFLLERLQHIKGPKGELLK